MVNIWTVERVVSSQMKMGRIAKGCCGALVPNLGRPLFDQTKPQLVLEANGMPPVWHVGGIDTSTSAAWACLDTSGRWETFSFIESYQIVVESEGQVYVDVENARRAFAAFPLVQVLTREFEAPAVPWGEKLLSCLLSSQNPAAHFTLVPCTAGRVPCVWGAASVFVSLRSSYPISLPSAKQVVLSSVPWETGYLSDETWGSVVDPTGTFLRPRWGLRDSKVAYRAPLSDISLEVIDLVLVDGARLELPISSTSYQLPVVYAVNSGEQDEVDESISQVVSGELFTAFDSPINLDIEVFIMSRGSLQCSDSQHALVIRGYGVVDGIGLSRARGGRVETVNELLGQHVSLRRLLVAFENEVLSGSVEVVSTSPLEGVPLQVNDVAVARPHKRMLPSAMQVNGFATTEAWASRCSVAVQDAKITVAFGESAGPNTTATGSLFSNLFVQSSKDCINACFDGGSVTGITSIQGNEGAVILLGNAGETSTDGITLRNIYTHRCLHSSAEHALVENRGLLKGNNVTNVTVDGLYVLHVGPRYSAVNRLFALGFSGGEDAQDTTLGTLVMKGPASASIRTTPTSDSVFYRTVPTDVDYGRIKNIVFYDKTASGDQRERYRQTAIKIAKVGGWCCVNGIPNCGEDSFTLASPPAQGYNVVNVLVDNVPFLGVEYPTRC